MENQKANSNLPLAIIGLVLLVAVVGGWWWYSSSKSQPAKQSNTNSSANKKAADEKAALELYAKAPVGAQPPNMLGSPTATVTLEEFADYQCPTCAGMHPKMKEINALYSGRIKFIFRTYPLTQIHKNAYEAAVAAEAAGLQGKFWAMQDQLFTNQKDWSNSSEPRKIFEEYAQKIGLNMTQFQSDVVGLPAKTRVDADLARARALNIQGTPTIYLNGRAIPAEQTEVNAMKQLIEAELQKAGGQPPTSEPGNAAANAAQPATNGNAANSSNASSGSNGNASK